MPPSPGCSHVFGLRRERITAPQDELDPAIGGQTSYYSTGPLSSLPVNRPGLCSTPKQECMLIGSTQTIAQICQELKEKKAEEEREKRAEEEGPDVVFLRSATQGLCPDARDNCHGMPARQAQPSSSPLPLPRPLVPAPEANPPGSCSNPNPAFSDVSQANFAQSPQKPYARLTPQSIPEFHWHSPPPAVLIFVL